MGDPQVHHRLTYAQHCDEIVDEIMVLFHQWEFQDPKMEVLYHIRPYFVGIFPYIGLI